MGIFTYLITKTDLGRAQRACEQDRTMTALLGINVDRTISITFIIGSSLASVAGMMFVLYYGVIDFYIGFLAGIKAVNNIAINKTNNNIIGKATPVNPNIINEIKATKAPIMNISPWAKLIIPIIP